MKEQQCRVCGEIFPCTSDYFYTHNETKNGLRKICKQCHIKETSEDNRKRMGFYDRWKFYDHDKLKEARINKKLSILDVHNITGINCNTLVGMERIGKRMRIEKWDKLKTIYGLEVD